LHLISFYRCRHFSSVCVNAHKQTLLSQRDLLTRARHEQNGYPQYCDGHWREDFYLAEELYIVDPKKMQLFMKKMNIKRLTTADKRKRLKDLATRLENQGYIARPAQVLSRFPLFCFWVFLAIQFLHGIGLPSQSPQHVNSVQTCVFCVIVRAGVELVSTEERGISKSGGL
jgi:hypothetical protein